MKIRRKSAMSLLITLAFIVIITILVVGFAETVRLARPAAASYLERSRADQYARSGVERVIATLNQYTADPNRNWISQPGLLIVGEANDVSGSPVDERKVLREIVPLHSGSAPAAPPANKIDAPPELNAITFRDPGKHVITDQTGSGGVVPPMEVNWVYVRRNGELDTSITPAFISSNPVVGRYAYWADDESSKVNYNIAWRKVGNTNAPGHPTKIELSALANFSETQADTLHSFVVGSSTNYNFFNTPYDARRIGLISGGNGVAEALQENKFLLTHYNHDPNTTFFNEPRIVLTTKPNRAGWTKATSGPYNGQWVGVNGLPWSQGGQPRYLRILKDPEDTTDPGGAYTASMDVNRLSETVAMLAWGLSAGDTNSGYLKRTDWPMVSGTGSFQSKFYSSYSTATMANGLSAQTSRLGQLAVNIIDYVRAKESTLPVVFPIIGKFDASQMDWSRAFVYQANGSSTNGYWGLTRSPYITEVAVGYRESTNATFTPQGDFPSGFPTTAITNNTMYLCFKVEVYLPRNYGISSYNLTNMWLAIQGGKLKDNARWLPNVAYQPADSRKIHASEIEGGNPVLTNGQYAVINRLVATENASTNAVIVPNTGTSLRFVLSAQNQSSLYQAVPGVGGFTNALAVNTNQSLALGDIPSYEVDDPRCNSHPGDWAAVSANSFGKVNSRNSVSQPAPGTLPEVDTDGGNVSDASFYMPPPAGTKFTRADGSIDDNSATGANGQVASVGELGYIHTGYEPCYNFNGILMPPSTPWRSLRLQPNKYPDTTVVPDWAFMDLFTAPVAPPNMYNAYMYAPHTTAFGGRVNVNSKAEPFGLARILPLAAAFQNSAYDSTIPASRMTASAASGVANNIYNRVLAAQGKQYGATNAYDSAGEVIEMQGVADNGEKSEELIRGTANLLTARGNVFTVFSVGQALQQTPNGKLSVVAEQRVQAMVERYSDSTNSIHFAPVYFRSLNP